MNVTHHTTVLLHFITISSSTIDQTHFNYKIRCMFHKNENRGQTHATTHKQNPVYYSHKVFIVMRKEYLRVQDSQIQVRLSIQIIYHEKLIPVHSLSYLGVT